MCYSDKIDIVPIIAYTIPVRIMGAKHEPVQPYLIEPKLTELLLKYSTSTENIQQADKGISGEQMADRSRAMQPTETEKLGGTRGNNQGLLENTIRKK